MSKSDRRSFLKTGGLLAAGTLLLKGASGTGVFSMAKLFEDGEYKLIPLPYAYDALEPFIDKKTMEFHHDKHHAAYVNNLNKALKEQKLVGLEFEKLLGSISKYPAAIRNNAGGHYNHTLFWSLMQGPKKSKPELSENKLLPAINSTFGSLEEFKKLFSEKAKLVFGSGWVWLVVGKDKKLSIGTTANQDNPIMDLSTFKGEPVLCLDVWEHAYYLKYENKRADYIDAWWNVVNWEEAGRLFSYAVR